MPAYNEQIEHLANNYNSLYLKVILGPGAVLSWSCLTERFIISVKTWSYGPGKRIKVLPSRHSIRSFSLMPKEMTKERAPASLGPSGTLRALKSAGSLKTQFKLLLRQISRCSAPCRWELNHSPFEGLSMPGPLDPDIYIG